jgi:hypothetical protein
LDHGLPEISLSPRLSGTNESATNVDSLWMHCGNTPGEFASLTFVSHMARIAEDAVGVNISYDVRPNGSFINHRSFLGKTSFAALTAASVRLRTPRARKRPVV